MDYYEELGLSRSASAEEIRQAYKNLARLLHPDQHQDENLRRVAECQMKRLNALVAVLTDPALRKQYDLSAAVTPLKTPHARRPANSFSAWVWVITALMGFGVIVWCLRVNNSKGSPVARAPARPVEPARNSSSAPVQSPSRLGFERERALAKQLAERETQLRMAENERDLLREQLHQPQPPSAGEALPPPPSIAQTHP